jgi:hypothetical protein
MTSEYYKKFDIVDGKFYQVPGWARKDFSGIPSREIKWQDGDRLDIIAEQVYGNPNDYKAILAYNNMGWIFDLQPGDSLYLPLRIKDVKDRL